MQGEKSDLYRQNHFSSVMAIKLKFESLLRVQIPCSLSKNSLIRPKKLPVIPRRMWNSAVPGSECSWVNSKGADRIGFTDLP
jgi:hypothetical protein